MGFVFPKEKTCGLHTSAGKEGRRCRQFNGNFSILKFDLGVYASRFSLRGILAGFILKFGGGMCSDGEAKISFQIFCLKRETNGC